MTISRSVLNIRFGYGLSPSIAPMQSVSKILLDLKTPNKLHEKFIRPSFLDRLVLFNKLQKARKDERKNGSKNKKQRLALQKKIKSWVAKDMQSFMAQAALSENGFEERLVAFWHDNFTVSGRNLELMLANGAYIDEAIRPNITLKFSDMLKAVVTHPAMLVYLDQYRSIGPNSPVGKKRKLGLNENLAREIIELHTMGVDSSYTQKDVREFAKLLTGLTLNKKGFFYNPRFVEPGAKVILGKTYGKGKPDINQIFAFLDDLSKSPETANHIAKKLAIHFVSNNPSKNLVASLKDIFIKSDGDLMALYEVLLNHKDSAAPLGDKIKWPLEYVVSAIRALSLSDDIKNASEKELKNLHSSMLAMGQDLFRPAGPDGWYEKNEKWINPPNLAARIEWGGNLANVYGQEIDPRILVKQVLGDSASQKLKYVVGDTESKWEGVALLLISPEFNRR